MTFWQRVVNTLVHGIFFVYDPTTHRDAVSRFAPEKPYISMDLLASKAEIWLVEMDHILDYPRPTLPNVRLIGGTATGPARPLKGAFKTFMDTPEQGVVVVFFGSYVLGLPETVRSRLFRVFFSLPMKVVFRSNLTSPDPAKILTSTWLPQNDLLAHPNTKVCVFFSF
jgi:hypothetical protein